MKNIILLLFLFVYSIGVKAQKTSVDKNLIPEIGIKGGLNLSNLYPKSDNHGYIKPGLNAGLYARLPITKNLALQPEVLYTMKGTVLNYDNIFLGKSNYRFKLDYIEIPVAMVIHITDRISTHAGPYVAILLSSNIKGGKGSNENGVAELNKGGFSKIDYGFLGGISYKVNHIEIGARYGVGLNDVGKSGLSGNLTQHSKNNLASFYVGLGL